MLEKPVVAVQKWMAVHPAQGRVTELLAHIFLYCDNNFCVKNSGESFQMISIPEFIFGSVTNAWYF